MLTLGACITALALFIPGYILWQHFCTKAELRRFPAPSIWASFTTWWMMWHNIRYKRYLAIDKAHKKLGAIVRIGPHHLSFSSPDAFYDIYGHSNANMIKDEYYDAISGHHRSTGSTRSREEHSKKRRVVAHAFSARGVTDYEPEIIRLTGQLVEQFDRKASDSSTFDIQKWINLWAFDVIGAVMYRNPFGFLEHGQDVCTAETEQGKQYEVNAISSFLDGVRWTMVVGYLGTKTAHALRSLLRFTHGPQMGANFSNMNIYRIRTRLSLPSTHPGNDIFSRFMAASAKQPKGQEMPLGEMVAEADALVNAGNDTITSAMTAVIFHLAKNPIAQAKLQEELDLVIPDDTNVCLPAFIKECQYLRACIDESLRDRPPVGIGLPRLTPPAGAKIDGHFIPGGTTVSAPTWTIHHDPTLFADPFSYKPERWFDEKEGPLLRKYSLPFSTGGRACVGRNLSSLQLEIAVATIFSRYKVELPDPNFELETLEWFNHSPGDLPVKLSRRRPSSMDED